MSKWFFDHLLDMDWSKSHRFPANNYGPQPCQLYAHDGYLAGRRSGYELTAGKQIMPRDYPNVQVEGWHFHNFDDRTCVRMLISTPGLPKEAFGQYWEFDNLFHLKTQDAIHFDAHAKNDCQTDHGEPATVNSEMIIPINCSWNEVVHHVNNHPVFSIMIRGMDYRNTPSAILNQRRIPPPPAASFVNKLLGKRYPRGTTLPPTL